MERNVIGQFGGGVEDDELILWRRMLIGACQTDLILSDVRIKLEYIHIWEAIRSRLGGLAG